VKRIVTCIETNRVAYFKKFNFGPIREQLKLTFDQ